MNNVIIHSESLGPMTVSLLAPGATKLTTKINIFRNESKVNVIVESDPIVGPQLKEVDLKVKEQFSVEKMYDTSKIKATVKNGIITIFIPVDTKVVQPVKID